MIFSKFPAILILYTVNIYMEVSKLCKLCHKHFMELYPNFFHHKRENSAFIPPSHKFNLLLSALLLHIHCLHSYYENSKQFLKKIKRLFSQHDFSTFLVITADFALFFLRLASKSVGRGKLSGAIGEECIYSSLKLLVKNQYILSNSRSRYRPSRVGVSLSAT